MSGDQYAAFISYSHADEKVARWLHRKLESYRTPRAIVGKSGRHGIISRRLGRIFRDREEFAAGGDLKSEIQAALGRSTALIVLCSARSKASTYVNAEIEHFRSLGRGDRIIPVILDGEPSECFPGALNDGVERLGADFREDRDEREGGLMKVLAGLLGVGVDELVRREQAAQRARVRLYAGAAAAFAGVAAAAVFFWFQSAYNERIAERRAAVLSIDGANAELAEGRTDSALLILLEAARTFANETPPDSLLIGFDAALRRAATESEIAVPANARFFDAPNGVYIVDPATFDISLLTADGEPRILGRAGGPPAFVAARPNGELVVVRSDYIVERIAPGGQPEEIGRIEAAELTPDPLFDVKPVSLTREGDALLIQAGEMSRNAFGQVFDLETRQLLYAPFNSQYTLGLVRLPDGRRIIFDGQDNAAEPVATRPSPAADFNWTGNWPADLPAPASLWAASCLSDNAPADLVAKFIETVNEAGGGGPGRNYCSQNGERALFSQNHFTSGGGVRENYIVDGYERRDVAEYVRAISSDPISYLSDPIANELAGYAVSWIDLVPDGEIALAANRDLLVISANEDATSVLARRFPGDVSYARILGPGVIAIADSEGSRLHLVRYAGAPAYGVRAPGEGEAFAPSAFMICAEEDQFERTGGDGAMLSAVVERTLTEDENDIESARLRVARTVAGQRTERVFDIDVMWACASFSSDLRHLALNAPGGALQIYDLAADGTTPIGEFQQSEAGFIGRGPSFTAIERGNVVARYDRGEDGAWRRRALYRGQNPIVSAELDPTATRLLMVENLGVSTLGAFVYSLESQRVWRRLGTEYKWLQVAFTPTGDIAVERRGELEGIFHPHTLAEAVAAAREALPERCRSFSGDNYTSSPCWPEALRN